MIETFEERIVLSPVLNLPASPITVNEDITSGLSETDPDPAATSFSVMNADFVMIEDGDPTGHFSVDYDGTGTATLRVSKDNPLDYETQNTFSLTITAMDMAGDSTSGVLIVNVTPGAPPQAYTLLIAVDRDADGALDGAFEDGEIVYLGPNDDDDNANLVPDHQDSGPLAVADDELVWVRITVTSDDVLDGHLLVAFGDGLRFWTDAIKSAEISQEEPLSISGSGLLTATIDVYMEGVEGGDTAATFELVPSAETVGDGTSTLELAAYVFWNFKNWAWYARLAKEQLNHQAYEYFEPSGIKALFATLATRTKTLSFGPNPNPGAAAAYQSWTDTVLVNSISTTAPLTAVHETIHAVDDENDWYLTGWTTDAELEKAEALAYTTEAILKNLGWLRRFEDRLRDGLLNDTNALGEWSSALSDVNTILNETVHWDTNGVLPGGQHSRTVNAVDLADVKLKLGPSLAFSVLMPKYQQLLNDEGIAVTLTMDVGSVHLAGPFR